MMRALVTEGASPLGEAICRQLASDGLYVTIHLSGQFCIQSIRLRAASAALGSDKFSANCSSVTKASR
jgi:NAD(P)-dependent dehydrogenase (short-subunit alcohol dehydrogenase family)